jgi:hypothetical protein
MTRGPHADGQAAWKKSWTAPALYSFASVEDPARGYQFRRRHRNINEDI